eukprot:2893332-Pleurochrysis_carterae.AAC.1
MHASRRCGCTHLARRALRWRLRPLLRCISSETDTSNTRFEVAAGPHKCRARMRRPHAACAAFCK